MHISCLTYFNVAAIEMLVLPLSFLVGGEAATEGTATHELNLVRVKQLAQNLC
jgi:hypothetical protein